jgi:hypothetical protein
MTINAKSTVKQLVEWFESLDDLSKIAICVAILVVLIFFGSIVLTIAIYAGLLFLVYSFVKPLLPKR